MKSEHRHELETNWLAKHLDVWIEQWKPYVGTFVGIIAVVAAAVVGWSLYRGSASSQHAEAWNAYNDAVAGFAPDLEKLRETAEAYPGSKMKELADITWADGQVWMATREYVYMRPAAMEALDRARSAYEGVLRTSSDPRLEDRARLGLARIYEMKNQLDKAKAEYEKVGGAFAPIAKMRSERLDEPDVKETYDWLATAQPPRPRAPLGPGTPGQTPDFSVGDLNLPAGPTATPGSAPGGPVTSLDTLFEGINLLPQDETPDRYNTESAGATDTEETAASDGAASDDAPADDAPADDAPEAGESPSSEKPAE